jgi:hypothetical protein
MNWVVIFNGRQKLMTWVDKFNRRVYKFNSWVDESCKFTDQFFVTSDIQFFKKIIIK